MLIEYDDLHWSLDMRWIHAEILFHGPFRRYCFCLLVFYALIGHPLLCLFYELCHLADVRQDDTHIPACLFYAILNHTYLWIRMYHNNVHYLE